MEKFNNIKSIPSYLSLQNIDTDMIIPKQKTSKAHKTNTANQHIKQTQTPTHKTNTNTNT